ncbi:VOC family protein [Salinimonas sediminis]|nr:VOC family protein [Salinimonas sediminis]
MLLSAVYTLAMAWLPVVIGGINRTRQVFMTLTITGKSVMDINPLVWFEIYVDDIKRARAFYETMLDTTLEELSDPSDEALTMLSFYGNHEAHGCSGALVHNPSHQAGTGGIIVYFSCDNCEQEQQRAQQAGGSVVQAKMAIGEYGHIALVKDTEGNTIGLHSLQ